MNLSVGVVAGIDRQNLEPNALRAHVRTYVNLRIFSVHKLRRTAPEMTHLTVPWIPAGIPPCLEPAVKSRG